MEFDLSDIEEQQFAEHCNAHRGTPSMLREIVELATRCSPDEQESILYLLRRIDKARAIYGALNLDDDTRDWDAEIRAEHADALAYEMFKRVQERRQR